MNTKTLRSIIPSCALAVPLLALNLQAQTTVAWKGSTTPNNLTWNLAANWALNRIPNCTGTNLLGDKADFNSSTQPPAFLSGLALPSQFMIGDNNPGMLYILSGGTLTSSNYSGLNSYNAIGYNSLARVEVANGGSIVSSNHLWVGLNTGARAQLVINGGTVTVEGMTGLGWSGGIGTVQVNGGSMNLWQWHPTNSISPLSQLDIRAGSVTISNDVSSSIANYIAGGQITGYGGVGTVHYSVVTDNVSNTNTVLTASCPPGAGGPYPVTNGITPPVTAFPTNVNPNLFVHYWTVDASADAPNGNWTPCLGLVTGGDQATTDVTFRGLPGKKASYGTSGCINVYDTQWPVWNTNGLIDVLLCIYGDANILRVGDPSQVRRLTFEEGVTPVNKQILGGFYATNAYNSQWNWVLFTITNNFQTNLIDRLIGSIPSYATGTGTSTNYGGINGGTIRIAASSANDGGVYNMSIRAVAFGQHGAFGTTPDINQFVLPDGSCPPVLNANLAAIDFNAGYTNNLQVINDPSTSQDVTFVSNVGPAGDQRKAVQPNNYYLNFGILSNYLGKPCNDNTDMKVCVDYYDDPAFAGLGVMFGPYAYANDSLGDITTLPFSGLATLQGTGKWIHQSWTIPSVNLFGVSTAPLTGGPQFISINGHVAVSRFYLAALRNSGPLAGQDPLADCYQDPNICNGVYGNYAELDLANGITNGVDLGDNAGDQTYVVETAGPVTDQRLSVRGDTAPSYYLNLQIVTNSLGPVTQGDVYLAVLVTYYDDPALKGQGFRPEVWSVQSFGSVSFAHMSSTKNIVLQGTGKWRDAYWEIGSMSFDGVNQHPAPPRFSLGAPIHLSRVRYAVVRPCGATAGQNLLKTGMTLSAAPDTNSLVRLSWPYRAPQSFLQSVPTPTGSWGTFSGAPVVEGEQSVLRFGPTNAASLFFRLSLTPQ